MFVVTHHDSHAVELDRVERIFVGDVVADVDRQHGARVRTVAAYYVLEEPIESCARATVNSWAELDNLATGGDPETLGAREFTGRRDHPVDIAGVGIAVMDSQCKALVLHRYSRNVTKLLRQSAGRVRQGIADAAGGDDFVVGAIRREQFHAVAAGIPDSVDFDPFAHIGEIAAAYHGH